MRPSCVNLVDGNCPRTFSLFGDYILRRTRSPVAPLFLSPLLRFLFVPLSLSKNLLSSRTLRLMSTPLGTFNSKDRVQISTAIRLARQLPLSSSFFVHRTVSPSLCALIFSVVLRRRNNLVSASKAIDHCTSELRLNFLDVDGSLGSSERNEDAASRSCARSSL